MGGVVARLRAFLGLESKEFEAGIRKSEGQARGLQNTIKSVGAAMGIAFSVGTLVQFGKSFMEWAGRISDAAGSVGILTSQMAALNQVFAENGLGVDELSKMFAKIDADIFAAVSGGKELDSIYGRLGFTLQDLAGMDPTERFEALAEAALKSANPTGALAELFGQKLGPKARLALESIVAGYDKVGEAQGKALDQLDNMGDRYAGFWNQFKMGLADGVVQMEKWGNMASTLGVAAGSRKDGQSVMDRYREIMAEQQKPLEDQKAMMAKQREEEKAAAAQAAREKKATQVAAALTEGTEIYNKHRENTRKEFAEKIKQLKAYQAERAKIREQIAQMEERQAERLLSIRESSTGVGVRADSMARIGGFAGGERAGLASLDRQTNAQIQVERALRENTVALQDLKEKLNNVGTPSGAQD